jgi:hypothetical protein
VRGGRLAAHDGFSRFEQVPPQASARQRVCRLLHDLIQSLLPPQPRISSAPIPSRSHPLILDTLDAAVAMSLANPFPALQVQLASQYYVSAGTSYSAQIYALVTLFALAMLIVVWSLGLRIRKGSFCESLIVKRGAL